MDMTFCQKIYPPDVVISMSYPSFEFDALVFSRENNLTNDINEERNLNDLNNPLFQRPMQVKPKVKRYLKSVN